MERNKVFDKKHNLLKAGGLITRKNNNRKEILIISSDHKSYSFPKGHQEPNETLRECAIRECFEETGLQTKIVKELPRLRYVNPETKDNIEVHLYQMKITGGELRSESKDIGLLWAPIEKAEEYFEYQNMKDYISSMKKLLSDS